MKTRIIHTKIWKDTWFTSLPRASSIIFLYLITCETNNICGTFELPDRNIMFDTGTNSQELEQAKKDLIGRVIFYEGWVHLVHNMKYNNYVTNPKMQIALDKELLAIPSKVKEYIDKYDTSIYTSIHTPNNHKSEIINQKSEINNIYISEEEILKISEDYNVPVVFVNSKLDDIRNYCKSKGKTYRDYTATLRNWVKRDAVKIFERQKGDPTRRVVDARGL